MNHWPFILLSYSLTLLGTIILVWESLASMRRAEKEAEALRDRN